MIAISRSARLDRSLAKLLHAEGVVSASDCSGSASGGGGSIIYVRDYLRPILINSRSTDLHILCNLVLLKIKTFAE